MPKTVLTIEMITREALRVLEDNLAVTKKIQTMGPEELEQFRRDLLQEAEAWLKLGTGEVSLEECWALHHKNLLP